MAAKKAKKKVQIFPIVNMIIGQKNEAEHFCSAYSLTG